LAPLAWLGGLHQLFDATVDLCLAYLVAAGLLGFPPKDLQYRFLAGFTPVFYIRQRDYSKVWWQGTMLHSLQSADCLQLVESFDPHHV
jgi:hypothetical protein